MQFLFHSDNHVDFCLIVNDSNIKSENVLTLNNVKSLRFVYFR